MAGLRSKFIEQLSCAICHELFTTPKLLRCLHRFCQACLQKYINREPINLGTGVSCPTCRKSSKIAFTDGYIRDKTLWAETFPTDFETESLCVMLREDSDTCPEHENQQVLGYCEVCNSCFCEQCNHKCFRFTPLEKAVIQRRKALKSIQTKSAVISDWLRNQLKETKEEKDGLKKNRDASTVRIKRKFSEMRQLIDNKEEKFLKHLDDAMTDEIHKLQDIEKEKKIKLENVSHVEKEISDALGIKSSARFIEETKTLYEDFSYVSGVDEPFQKGEYAKKTDMNLPKGRLEKIAKCITDIFPEGNIT